jgi:hypothetical protein
MTPTALDEPLPAEVLRRLQRGAASYGSFSVFSAPWLRRRTFVFALVTTLFGALSGLFLAISRGPPRGVAVFGHAVVGGMLISTLGPALATFVRHRRLAPNRERLAVVGALTFGTLCSFVADRWASAGIDRAIGGNADTLPSEGALAVAFAVAGNALALVAYGMLGGWLAVARYFREARCIAELASERERAASEARRNALEIRLGVLQAQVEPHFLFNTLSSVRSLIMTEPERACATVDALADYLRATIPRLRCDASSIASTLGAQIDLCESYLALMRVRMGDRLSTRVAVDESLRDVPFSPLILLTLVENAVRHGVEPKRGPGTIGIEARRIEGDRIEVKVVDDGGGLREGFGAGVGLDNVFEALRLRYGDAAILTLSSASQGAGGTVATIVIPAAERAP